MHGNDNDKQSSWMMRAMMICCAVPLLFIIIFGAGGKASGFPTWVVVGVVAVMMAAHFFMIGRSHKRSDGGHEIARKEDKNKGNKDNDGSRADHGCCH